MCGRAPEFEIFLLWFGNFPTLIEFPPNWPGNYKLNWVYPGKDPEWGHTWAQGLLCPRRQSFVEVSLYSIVFVPPFLKLVSRGAGKRTVNQINIEKTWDLVWGPILGVYGYQKNLKPIRHRKTGHASQRYTEASLNPCLYTWVFPIVWSMLIAVSDWPQTFFQACIWHVW